MGALLVAIAFFGLMALGMPVITTNVTAQTEYLAPHTALLVPTTLTAGSAYPPLLAASTSAL